MKRFNNLYEQVYNIENLVLADAKAQKGKSQQNGVIAHNQNKEGNIVALHEMLVNQTYRTSKYVTFIIHEPKEREVYRLPYFPDRILHHAVLNILEPIFTSVFTDDSYSCIKGKGIHAAVRKLKHSLKDKAATKYCLKLDLKKFYPSVDHTILKSLLRRKFKDRALLGLLDGIIDSAEGLPIGNYLSQYFANYYLTWFDHWIKEKMGVKHYFRYADDLVILSDSKEHLHFLLGEIKAYLTTNLKLTVKNNYQIFPIDARGIDFLGYVFYHTHTLLRKRIKQNLARKIAKGANAATISGYIGWTTHANTKHLLKKILNERFQDFRNNSRKEEFYRRQNKDEKDFEHAHCVA